ncbi:MAG: tRNA (guanosine(46)-N7)-methyltransferase TrmB [Xanthomonadaceae bacterium]|nr:tRNA (guanosine(46)-N7)-methyltransferase TrmB [Xanthomonadaceae bacterium]
MDPTPDDHRRRIRSFVRRPGRMTSAQQRALDELLPRYRIDESQTDLRQAFDRAAPLVIEIGFGNGDALAWMAERESERNFIGIEVHEPGVGRLLRRLADLQLDNVRVAMRDAVEVLRAQIVKASVAEVRIYFPDPWPKKRHHKRRLIQPGFIDRVSQVLQPGGLLHLATDWAPYAEWMHEVLDGRDDLENLGSPDLPRPEWRPHTHFEQRGLGKGHAIFDLVYRRRP